MAGKKRTGCIRQRKDGRWETRLTMGKHRKTGKYIVRSAYAGSETEAQEQLQRLREESEWMDFERASAYTVGEWAEEWFRTHAEGRAKPNTEGGYRNLIFHHISPELSDVALGDLTEKRVREFYASLPQSGLGSRSVWCVHLLLRRILDEACRERLIFTNPATNCTVPTERGREPKQLRPGQVRRYLDAAEEMGILPMIYVGLSSGLRQGELFALPWAAFDMQSRQIILGSRLLTLSNKAAEHLVAEHEKHLESHCVFLDGKTGEPYTPHRFYYLHRQMLKRARLPTIGFRDLQLNFKEMEL
ncbi:MAG: site-specific integrase [Oscillospiraceae bacterium]|jgi:integrase